MRKAMVVALALARSVSLGGCDRGADRAAGEHPAPDAPAARVGPRESERDGEGEGGPASTGASTGAAPGSPQDDARHIVLPCRAIAVDGDVHAEGEARPLLAAQAPIAAAGWLTLGPGARLVAKDPRSSRETTFRGPARVRACVGGAEESWVAAGTFESTVGAGESPGAEEWVVTPLGVVRFGAARLAVQVSSRRWPRDGVRLALNDGTAFVWMATDATDATDATGRGVDGGVAPTPDEGWVRVAAGSVVTLAARAALVALASTGGRTPLDAARSAVDTCTSIGTSARDLASALLGGDAAVGPTAVRQVTTRRLARAACAVAALRLDRVPSGDAPAAAAKATLAASLHAAFDLWRGLPSPAHGNGTPRPP
jgi:hypothetical protein